MCLNRLFQDVSAEPQELIWPDLERLAAADSRGRLERRLREATGALGKQCAAVEELRQRVSGRERQTGVLAERIRVFLNCGDRANAYTQALDLDRLRSALARDQAELRRQQQVYRNQLSHVQHLQQELAEVDARAYPFS